MKKENQTPQIRDARTAKKFFTSWLKSIFPDGRPQCRYSSGDIVRVIRNAVSLNEYIETYVRNSTYVRTPSGDTVFRWIKYIGSESGSHQRKGSLPLKRKSSHLGLDTISDLNDLTVRIAIANGSFQHPVNVAIDEHDEPYYGMDNRYLINAPFHKFRGTDMAYRFATADSVKNGERFTLSVMKKDPLDGIDNAMEVDLLLRHVISLGVAVRIVLMDRGYLDAGVMRKVESLHLRYIIPARDNPKVLRFREMEMKHCDSGLSFLVIRDTVSSSLESIETTFVHVIYYPDRKRHDFSFYTNIDVTEGNARELAEIYRERWGIENGYLEKKDVKEKTHSPEMGVRYFLFFLSVLLYNMWMLLNLMRRLSGYSWITLMDFVIAMSRGRWHIIMNDNG
ncbi:MAG: transposase [Candidatus Thermoplasmatota archaeon]|nr:transposase [Candidatus Thermoplasmatota archaeon]